MRRGRWGEVCGDTAWAKSANIERLDHGDTRPVRAKSSLLRCWNSLGIWRRSCYSENLSRGGREIGETTINKDKGDSYFRIKPNGAISCDDYPSSLSWWVPLLLHPNKSIQQFLPNPADYEVTRFCRNQHRVLAPSLSESKPASYTHTVCVAGTEAGASERLFHINYMLTIAAVKDWLPHLGHKKTNRDLSHGTLA